MFVPWPCVYSAPCGAPRIVSLDWAIPPCSAWVRRPCPCAYRAPARSEAQAGAATVTAMPPPRCRRAQKRLNDTVHATDSKPYGCSPETHKSTRCRLCRTVDCESTGDGRSACFTAGSSIRNPGCYLNRPPAQARPGGKRSFLLGGGGPGVRRLLRLGCCLPAPVTAPCRSLTVAERGSLWGERHEYIAIGKPLAGTCYQDGEHAYGRRDSGRGDRCPRQPAA